MTTEAEKRVARAMASKLYAQYTWDQMTVPEQAAFVEAARAAIDEMNRMAEEQFGHKVFVEAEKREVRN